MMNVAERKQATAPAEAQRWLESFEAALLARDTAAVAALVLLEPGQPPIVTTTGPAKALPPTAQPPSSGTAAGALQHYHQALDALRGSR